jgi:cellulose synthase/poly-beta-1,6-N-acetylglucosamine synthase-like glycosyltransferase
MMLAVFWSAVGLVVYTYVLFPLLQLARGLLRRRAPALADFTPHVSMVICAHNEAESIGEKIENVLSLDYPPEQLDVVIASDGSDDGTEEIVGRYAGRRVQLLSLPRQGKIPALNTAVRAAAGEILVFSDANSLYAPDAIRALLRPFADPRVGGVAGDQRYEDHADTSGESSGERTYWDFDRKLKEWQSRAGSVTSATGAIYAIRRALFSPVPSSVTDDFWVSTGVIDRGYRLVFAPNAIAYERPAASSGVEFQRKVRVITRGLRGVLLRRRLLNPFRHGFYALQLFSHKVLRRLVVLPLLVLLATTPWLWQAGPFYQAALVGQAGVYGLAAVAALLGPRRARSKLFTIPFFFCMVNLAALIAALNVARGRRIDSWQPTRNAAPQAEGHPSSFAGRREERFS